jgi:hypothetical protein
MLFSLSYETGILYSSVLLLFMLRLFIDHFWLLFRYCKIVKNNIF